MTTRVIPMNRRAVVETEINIFTCAGCGVLYGIGAKFTEFRRKDGKTFYCPNGCDLSYKSVIKSDLERAESERDAARSLAERESRRRVTAEENARHADYQRRAAKGQLTRMKKRIAGGVCPCCKRSFANVRNHMEGQHPEFVAEHRSLIEGATS